jgi:hypothetical protein
MFDSLVILLALSQMFCFFICYKYASAATSVFDQTSTHPSNQLSSNSSFSIIDSESSSNERKNYDEIIKDQNVQAYLMNSKRNTKEVAAIVFCMFSNDPTE